KLGGASSLTLLRSTVSGNGAGQGGGIAVTFGSKLRAEDSTISGNMASQEGGGIYLEQAPGLGTGARARLTRVTIAANSAAVGGGFYMFGGIARLQASILADNSAPQAPDCRAAANDIGQGRLGSGGSNLIEDPSQCTFRRVNPLDVTGVDPMLGPLQDN